MKKKLLGIAILGALGGIVGCQHGVNEPSSVSQTAGQQSTQTEAQKLAALTGKYFDESLARNPLMATFVGVSQYNDEFNDPLSPQSLADAQAFEQKYLQAVNKIDSAKLTGQDWLSYKIFKYDREHALAGFQFGAEYLPLSQMGGVHTYFAMMGSGQSAQPFNTEEDYRNFIARAQGFADYMDSTIVYMQKGIEKDVVLPKPIAEKVLPQLSSHVVPDVTQSVFYGPIAMLEQNESIPASEKEVLKNDYLRAVTDTIIPAYHRVYQFMQNDYLSRTRNSVGLAALPKGKAWYEYQIATHTTLPLTAEAIHEFGQQEVSRIRNEMTQVKQEVGFQGDLQEFFTYLRTDDSFYFASEQDVIDAYTNIKQKIDARLPQLFNVFPRAGYEVRAVEPYRSASAAGASYQPPAPDGSRPGIFYINTRDLKAQPKFLMETLSIHEAAPGHHFQIAIQQEVEGLPEFRKFNNYTVFAEGWALYAESLGKEMGLFSDPYMWYGRLADEQLRAMRLVVDTGLHAKGWTREQAIDFMLSNSSMAESDVVAEVERYISMPGQALAYKIGERHIRQLRQHAASELGEQFDIREFHKQVLTDGAVPMRILSEKINRWIESEKQKA